MYDYTDHITGHRIHFKNRLWERYKKPITKEEYFLLCRYTLLTPTLKRSFNNRTYHEVVFKNTPIIVIYDHNICTLVTCLLLDRELEERLYRKRKRLT